MEKRIILPSGTDIYSRELECVLATQGAGIPVLRETELSTDYLLDNKVAVVISNRLPERWYRRFQQLNIVSLSLGPLRELHRQCDIVVDPAEAVNNKYFSGPEFSVLQNSFDVIEIADLVMKLDWDSGFFGFPIAYVTSKYLTPSIAFRVSEFIERHQIRLVEYLCNCHDDVSVRIAEENGFHFTDIRFSLWRKTDKCETVTPPEGLRFGQAEEEHIPRLREIGAGLYLESRYYFDGSFEEGKIDEFYRSWIEKGVRGRFDDCCYCLFEGNMPVGFCTVRHAKERNRAAKIGVFGIAREWQGNGIGKLLLHKVIAATRERGAESIFVVTQGRNYPAQRLYQSVGFRTHGNELWYHKWLKR
jgi:ribosomal protein S18 acetylase RimI-like enzyme